MLKPTIILLPGYQELHRIRKQAANRLTIMDTLNRLGEQGSHREDMHSGQTFFRWYWNSVGRHNLFNIRLRTQALDSVASEQPMRGDNCNTTNMMLAQMFQHFKH